jgi:hypothetical protein
MLCHDFYPVNGKCMEFGTEGKNIAVIFLVDESGKNSGKSEG